MMNNKKLPGGGDPFKEGDKCCCCIDIKTGVLVLGILIFIGAFGSCAGIGLTVLAILANFDLLLWGIFICVSYGLNVLAAFPFIGYFKNDSGASRARLQVSFLLFMLGSIVRAVGASLWNQTLSSFVVNLIINCVMGFVQILIYYYYMTVVKRWAVMAEGGGEGDNQESAAMMDGENTGNTVA